MRKQIQRENDTLNQAPYQLYLPMDVGVRIEASEKVRFQHISLREMPPSGRPRFFAVFDA